MAKIIIRTILLFHFTSLIVAFTACDPCDFDHPYQNISFSPSEPIRYKYQINDSSQVVRVWIQSLDAAPEASLILVVRETRAVLSWQVPLMLKNRYLYSTVSRTLCPVNETTYQTSSISVELSTASRLPVHFSLNASLIDNFYLSMNQRRVVVASPSEPQYLAFVMPDDVDTVMVRMSSSDSHCMVISVQDIQCPVFDLDTNVQFNGLYQTVSTKGALTVSRSKFKQFYIVFVVQSDDLSCYPDKPSTILPAGAKINRVKRIEVWVEPTINENEYIFAISITVGCFAAIYLLAFGLTIFFDYRENKDEKMRDVKQTLIAKLNGERSPISGPAHPVAFYGSLDPTVSENLSASCPMPSVRSKYEDISGDETCSDSKEILEVEPEVEEEDYDTVPDAALDKRIIRSKAHLCVSDLSRKHYKTVNKKYSMYFWNLCTIAIFYTLPVVQLVLTYQTVVAVTGNEDLCYYNFDCVRPLGVIFAFNNIFSNVGYVLLGLLFFLIVRKRDHDHQKQMTECETLECHYGIPRHFGLFYSMGVALSMEGVLSACYHVCPNYTNFQFDTAFMYMIAALGMLKIYQMRHPDINAHAHVAYAVMALVILLAVIGVLYNGLPFWIIFSVCYTLLIFMLSAEFYFKSEWKLDKSIFHKIRLEWLSSRRCSFFMPAYPDRMIYLLLCNAVNITFVVLGLLKRPKDFPSFVLTVFISNLMLYLMFYIVMKLRHREKLYLKVVLLLVISCFTWAAGLFFFSQNRSSWMKTPAESRQLNSECVFLDFYDSHDVWHFLSALSLFLSFMVVLVIDDDLVFKPQDVIPVF